MDQCEFKRDCPICGKLHDLNLHNREDVKKHFENTGSKGKEDRNIRKEQDRKIDYLKRRMWEQTPQYQSIFLNT